MFKTIAVLAFSLLAATSALASELSLYLAYDREISITASVQPSFVFMGDGVAAEQAGLAAVDVEFTGSTAPSPVEHMGDGLAMEQAALSAFLTELETTGSLGLLAWEAEEPALVQAYIAGRDAYEAILTP